MSATDQAFLRAYRDPTARSSKPEPSAAASSLGGQDSGAPTAAQSAQLLSTTIGLTDSRTVRFDTFGVRSEVVDVAMSGTPGTNFGTIQVGLGASIPAPHAVFGEKRTAIGTTSGVNSKSGGPRTPQPRLPVPAAHVGFGQSLKASLSSFAMQAASASQSSESPKPALEVDSFRWTPVGEKLLSQHTGRFGRLADEVRREAAECRRVVGITGIQRGEGRTTLALCLARQLTAGNTKVAVVDADFASGKLAEHLGLGIECGWEAVLDGGEAVWEVMIESTQDRLAILPLVSETAEESIISSSYRIAATMQELANQYEVVIVDAGPLVMESSAPHWLLKPGSGVDSLILTHDVRRGDVSRLAAACLQIAEAGQRQLGIAEMFSDENGSGMGRT
jgi:Mrp family chromosome partitioning ATPase